MNSPICQILKFSFLSIKNPGQKKKSSTRLINAFFPIVLMCFETWTKKKRIFNAPPCCGHERMCNQIHRNKCENFDWLSAIKANLRHDNEQKIVVYFIWLPTIIQLSKYKQIRLSGWECFYSHGIFTCKHDSVFSHLYFPCSLSFFFSFEKKTILINNQHDERFI